MINRLVLTDDGDCNEINDIENNEINECVICFDQTFVTALDAVALSSHHLLIQVIKYKMNNIYTSKYRSIMYNY